MGLAWPAAAGKAPRAHFDPVGMSWAIENDRIRAEFRLLAPEEDSGSGHGRPDIPLGGNLGSSLSRTVMRKDQGAFLLVSVSEPNGRIWAPPPETPVSPIYLTIGDDTLDESTVWRHLSTIEEPAPRQGVRQVIALFSELYRVEMDVNLEVYPDQPFLHCWLVVKNLADEGRFIRRADIVHWRFSTFREPVKAFFVNQYLRDENARDPQFPFRLNEVDLSETPGGAVVFSGAHGLHISWLALSDQGGAGLVAGWEFNGRAHITARQSRLLDALEIVGGPDDLYTLVNPGKPLTLPASFLGLFSGDWDEAAYRTQRFVEAVLAQPVPDEQFPYVMYNTWGYDQDINENLLRRAAEIAAFLGVEVFVVDLGWARQIGEWDDDRGKFPGGLRAFADYVHSLGMKFGLHWVPVEAAPEAPPLRGGRDWTSTESDDYFGAVSLCLGHGPTQGWARQTLLEMVDRYQVDWLTQDGENLVKECRKTTHTHHAQNSNWANSVEGIDALVKFARQELPALVWENQGDGGSMLTYESVKRYVTAASCDACPQTERRQAVYGMSYAFPTRFIDRYMTDRPITSFVTRSSMFGGPWILMERILEWTPEEIATLKKEIPLYKLLRTLIREGKVYHLLERPDGIRVDAIESFHPERDQGVIFVYRPGASSVSTQSIYPKGLRPQGTYRVTFQDDRGARIATGAELMAGGIAVPLPKPETAEIVYLNVVR